MNSPASTDYAGWKRWSASEFATFSPVEASYFKAEMAHAGMDPGRHLDILEIGFGNGSFLGWARSRGHRLTGIETLPPAIQRARLAGVDCHASLDEVPPDRKFDAVVAFDVFEHVSTDKLERLLHELGSHLKDDGRIIARFPNGGSPFGLFYQHGDLTHVTSLSEGAVSHLAASAGLKLSYCGAPRLPIHGVGWTRAMRRVLQLSARAFIEAIFRQVYFDGRPACLSPNLLAVFHR